MATALELNADLLKQGALVLRALNNKLRQQIIKAIQAKGAINVTQLYKKLKIEQSVASQHLRILRDAGFVNTERNGKEIYYALNYSRFEQVDGQVKSILS